jgi:ferredoxin-NADP reductase
MFARAGRARANRMGEDFDAAGHLSRSTFDKAGFPREADVYLCGPTRFIAEMKEALAALGMALADSRRNLRRQRVQ